MSDTLSLTRAARLIGVTRAELQKKIQRGEMVSHDGMVTVGNLLACYPDAQLEDTAESRRVARIKERAFGKRVFERALPDAEVLAARITELGKTLANSQEQVKQFNALVGKLWDKLAEIEPQLDREARTAMGDLKTWVKQEIESAMEPGFINPLAIKDKVLFIGTSFGTVNTLPLQKQLERDGLIAYPASLSSEMAAHAHTPPLAPSYKVEAMRAMDWAVEHAGGADKVKAGIVYQKDDYGNDGIAGWKEAAEHHKVSIVAEHAIKPGEKDVAAVIKGLQEKGANYVLLTILPSSTGPVLGTAAATKYAPVWIGNTPAWIDAFFSEQVQASLPPAVFGKFYWVTGLSYWGEDVPALASFRATWDKHGKDLGPPDFYILASYAQGLTQVEAFRIALENKDVSRAGYLKAVQSLKEFTAGGMFQPIDLTKVPYVTSTQTRVLQPDFAGKTWKEVAGYAAPQAMAAK